MSQRPLLFVDVDGVINTDLPHVPVTRHEIEEPSSIRNKDGSPIRRFVVLPEGIERRIATLAEQFDMVWCTTWFHAANRHFSSLLNQPAWPVVSYSDGKLDPLMTFADGRPWAFVDDDVDYELRAATMPISDNGLIVRIDPRTGLTDQHVSELTQFARSHDRK
jgi:hypothetical protein